MCSLVDFGENRRTLSSLKKKIDAQIDWDFIAKKKKDPVEFKKFLEKGRRILALTNTLKSIQNSS